MSIRACLFALLLPAPVLAQEPLSVIEWLGRHPIHPSGPVLYEPPVSESALQPPVEVSRLDTQASPIGLVPARITGLPASLWAGSATDDLVGLVQNVPVQRSPAMQTLLYTLLLSETVPPADDRPDGALLLARIDRLMELGATDPALALAEQVNPSRSAALFRRWFDASLLTGAEDQGCELIAQAPHLAPDYATRIFCTARLGDWQTAALTLETAHALNLLPPQQMDLLDRFLSPDVFEGAPPLPAPQAPDPLTFRLFETIGERLPTASLPRAFATADLRDIAGWKAQLMAAERLTRIGALAPNQLLGLYTARRPSASGGIWDRVRALQSFDRALQARDSAAVARALPAAWDSMRQAGLEVAFASLFASDLKRLPLDDPAAGDLAWRILLLSPQYKSAARHTPRRDPESTFLAALAQGDPGRVPAPNTLARAIVDGFSSTPDPTPPDPARLGETILRAMQDFDAGARGNPAELGRALGTFRAVGLEDTARRAALQLMLLGTR
ncbi:hypothetical protein ACFMPD_04945 [Sedimentitalea sp. HM32M-2]|uniref:hypothetical protein n=1 Tax=Sedimentitalea sp. HM32M-2 TaxID=3351566 RepID=UPI00362AC4EA